MNDPLSLLRAALAKATPGRWRRYEWVEGPLGDPKRGVCVSAGTDEFFVGDNEDDARAIALLMSVREELLACVEPRECDSMRSQRESWNLYQCRACGAYWKAPHQKEAHMRGCPFAALEAKLREVLGE